MRLYMARALNGMCISSYVTNEPNASRFGLKHVHRYCRTEYHWKRENDFNSAIATPIF